MKFGHKIKGEISNYDEKGRGTFTITNQDKTASAVAVPFSARGDDLTATFIKRDSEVKIGRIEKIEKPGPDRVAAPCPHAGSCGGCLWQHIGYEAQLKLKREMINRAFARAGHEERIEEVAPCPMPFHYRNRMDFAVGWLGTIGLKEFGCWNRYLDLKNCLLIGQASEKILETSRALIKECNLEPWDAVHHSGLFRYVVVREGKNTDERMIMPVFSDLSRVGGEARTRIAEKFGPLCASLLLGEQPKPTDISCVSSFETLKGSPWLEENINGTRYRIAPNSFFQTNSLMAAQLQKIVSDFIKDAMNRVFTPDYSLPTTHYKLLDLYCGLGFFGIHLARQLPNLQVNGYEIDAEATVLAKQNAKMNAVADRIDFFSGPAEDLSWKEVKADAVILDPPRSGLHPRVLRAILEKKPETLIYISCNYRRLAEELNELKREYRVDAMKALDLFPHTPHAEVVAKLVL